MANTADEDAEIALLHSMQAGDNEWSAGVEESEGVTEEQDGLPAITEYNEAIQEVTQEHISNSGTPMGDSESLPVPTTVSAAESRASSTAPKKPRTVGGFIADSDSEDEVETPAVAGKLSPIVTETPAISVPQSPLRASVQPDVPQSNVSAEGALSAGVVTNLAAVIPDTGSENVVQPPQTLPVPVPNGPVSSSKARLPHDKVGILEDRIKEDPRGDMDAWLSLIAEHRKRNKLDDARAVYERFFKVFPTAVSHVFITIECKLIMLGGRLGCVCRDGVEQRQLLCG